MMRLWTAPHGLHVEPARAEDAADMARLHAAGFYRGWPREDFSAYLAEGAPAYVACDAKRRVAGFALLRETGDEAELITIAIDPKWRGKGVGSAVLGAALADLRTTPARRLLLEVAEDNPAALALYRRHGFREIARRNAYYARAQGAAATAIVMACEIG